LASGTDIRLVDVWRRDDAKIAADAIALRRKLSLLPASVSPEDRAKELCAATYLQNELIGVSTMVIDILPPAQGAVRLLPLPRRASAPPAGIGRDAWRLFPQPPGQLIEAQSAGKGARQGDYCGKLDAFNKKPVWEGPPDINGLVLVGYTSNGKQIRVSWFEHARLD